MILKYCNFLFSIFPSCLAYEVYFNKEIIIVVPSKIIKEFFFFLKNHTNCQYKVLSDVCAVDYIKRFKRFAIVYNLLSISYNSRIRIKTYINEFTFLDSISSIFTCANWWEREIFDLFGIFFTNHPDLRRILTDYGFVGYPLRKDFPLSGFIEVNYDDLKKKINYSSIQLDAKLRCFNFNNLE